MRGSSAAQFPYPRDQAGFLRCAPQVHRVVRHPVRRYDGSATAPPSVKGFGSHLLSTDARSCCLLGAPCRIRTLLTIRWISGKARAGEFLITLNVHSASSRVLTCATRLFDRNSSPTSLAPESRNELSLL